MTHVAIVGGGFSGTLQAIQLLRRTRATVTLIERADRLARGVAYSTRHAEHLLNVRAGSMSALPDHPAHFAEWLERQGGGDGKTFAERRVYGRYIAALLDAARADAGERLRIVEGETVDIEAGAAETVRLADGREVETDAVILSIGNLAPEVPRALRPDLLGDFYVADPWASDIAAGLGDKDIVLLIGTGLTAIDAALMLDAAGFKGRIIALSRRGLVPRAHAEPAPPPGLERTLEPRCGPLLRNVRAQAERVGWRAAVDQLRPVTQALWASASIAERRRFLRHLRPWWDVHRHRIAPEIAERIAAMERDGRLVVAAGKLVEARPGSVTWRPRGSEQAEEIAVRRIVNCTGPQGDIARACEPLLANLLKAGRIRPDTCRIGIDVDDRDRTLDAAGTPSPSLYAIGPMTRGAHWEIVAVPDIRQQVAAVAERFA